PPESNVAAASTDDRGRRHQQRRLAICPLCQNHLIRQRSSQDLAHSLDARTNL
ncbi:hypothetical protein LPJ75_006534, partial [Coemansia sp. RSA 2598]